MFLRHLRTILLIFLGLHLAEIVACVLAFMLGAGNLVAKTILCVMGADIALSGVSLLLLSVLGARIQAETIDRPADSKQLLVLSILHFVATLGVIGMFLVMFVVGTMDGNM
jgi:hypothetical protein